MVRHTKYNKKIRITYIASAVIIGFTMLVAFPWKYTSAVNESGYFVAKLNGVEIGSAASMEDIDSALKAARLKINTESEGLTCMEQELEVKSENRITGIRLNKKQLEERMYNALVSTNADNSDDDNMDMQKAYVVNIDDFTVTLSSQEEVKQLLNAAKSEYDTENQFQIDLVEEDADAYAYMTTATYKLDKEPNESNLVMASEGGQAGQESIQAQQISQDGVVDISFAEDIQVLETYTDSSKISDLQTAIDEVTKDKEENQTYVVSEGDCLSSIAEKHNLYMAEILGMNPGLTADSVIGIGDLITVTVPKPELSVIVKKQMTYEESFSADVQYVYNDSRYTNEQTVLSEGADGYRQVTVVAEYENGEEISRNIVSQNVIQEPVPKVIEVGTMVPPTFIKPLAGGRLSSGFGARWGRMHKGVDWACPTGTAINASCGGKVVTAGWVGGYGYCVEIAHSNGNHTRYGHLSKILVSAGDTVAQGDRIALSGNTGDSTGPHVHFEIIVGGSQVDPFSLLN